MSIKDEFVIDDIEQVTVNDMKMWRLGGSLFLTKSDAIRHTSDLGNATSYQRTACCLEETYLIDRINKGKMVYGMMS